jgi:putative redox protein
MKAAWQGKMKFESSNAEGRSVLIDAKQAASGEESAQSPKQLVLNGLVGCTGMDVISLPGKMRTMP